MCGLAGYAVKKYHPNLIKAGIILAVLNENRGGDSWGMTDGKEIIKDVGPITMGLAEIPFDRPIVALHTRAATRGHVTRENAHPWRIGKIIGMHNGGVSNHEELNKEKHTDYAVDSMQIFDEINRGHLTLSKLNAWWAITFFDKDGDLRLAKFQGGALAIAMLKDDGLHGIMWSSDKDHLHKALNVLGIEHRLYALKENMVYKYRDGVLHDTHTVLKIAARYAKSTHNDTTYPNIVAPGHVTGSPFDRFRRGHENRGVAAFGSTYLGAYRFLNKKFVWAQCFHAYHCLCYDRIASRKDSLVADYKIEEINEAFGYFNTEGIFVHCPHSFARVVREDISSIKTFTEEDLKCLTCDCLPRSQAEEAHKLWKDEQDAMSGMGYC